MNLLRMFLMRMFLMLVLLGLTTLAYAAEEPKFVSTTFQDIQSRVLQRDPECDAILKVQAKEDASRLRFGLDFSIQEVPNADEAVIKLSVKRMSGDGLYEMYRLRLDDAMRQELQNQKRLKQLGVERSAKASEDQKKKITELSEGKLRYGMSLNEVIQVKGQPQKVEQRQAAGGFTAIYPDMSLNFSMTKLTDIELTHK